MAKDLIYEKIAAHLKDAIESGELRAGDAIYSENILCEKFQVSRTSVRKAIRQMVEENLLVSHQGKGTFVKSSGHGVIHNAICLANHWSRIMRYEFCDSYFRDLIFGSEKAVSERGAACLIYSGAIFKPDEIASKCAHLKVDGLLLDGRYQDYMKDLEAFKAVTPHIVLLEGNPSESPLPSVAPDFEAGYLSLLKLALGKRPGGRTAFLYHDQSSVNRFRFDCFKRACAKAGTPDAELLNYGENVSFDCFSNIDHYPLVHASVERWTRSLETASGTLLCACDYSAAKAMKALKSLGFETPRDFAVAGFGGVGFGELTSPSLTTVKADSGLVGERAAAALFDMIEGRARPPRLLSIPAKLLERDSL